MAAPLPSSRSRSGCLGEGGTLKGRKTKQPPGGQRCAVPKMYWPFSAQCCDYRETICWLQKDFKSSFGQIEVCFVFQELSVLLV